MHLTPPPLGQRGLFEGELRMDLYVNTVSNCSETRTWEYHSILGFSTYSNALVKGTTIVLDLLGRCYIFLTKRDCRVYSLMMTVCLSAETCCYIKYRCNKLLSVNV